MTPDRVCVPAASVSPPLPPIEPAKLPEALVRVSVLVPSATLPEPDSDLIDVLAPETPETSNTLLATTPLEFAMLPAPVRASVPAEMVVRPL